LRWISLFNRIGKEEKARPAEGSGLLLYPGLVIFFKGTWNIPFQVNLSDQGKIC
jgi:hypothetical protein